MFRVLLGATCPVSQDVFFLLSFPSLLDTLLTFIHPDHRTGGPAPLTSSTVSGMHIRYSFSNIFDSASSSRRVSSSFSSFFTFFVVDRTDRPTVRAREPAWRVSACGTASFVCLLVCLLTGFSVVVLGGAARVAPDFSRRRTRGYRYPAEHVAAGVT